MSINKNEMSIYAINAYKDAKIIKMKPLDGTNEEILKELNNNKGYHLLFKNEGIYSLFFDLDHVHNDDVTHAQDILNEAIEEIAYYLDCPTTFIKYTESIKTESEYSFHLSVPFFKASYSTIKYIAELIKKNPLLSDYIDSGIYTNNRLFRLPNQTNTDKPQAHIIKFGEMWHFINTLPHPDAVLINFDDQKLKKQLKQEKQEKQKQYITNQKTKSKINEYYTDDQLFDMLNELDDKYLNEYNDWLLITNILKNIDKFDLWSKWSMQSKKYNKTSNLKIWRNLKKLDIGIDHLLKLLNIENPIKPYKQYEPLTFDLSQINYKHMNQYRLYDQDQINLTQFVYDDIIKNKLVILESCTGTGKTTATAKLLKQYIANYGYMNIISIISRITLGYQIEDSFLKEDITFKNYQNDSFNDYDNYIVCVNSLKKLQDITPEQLKHYIVYIDEINSFTKSLTHNDQLTPILKDICLILFKIIKYAHKIIVSDAVISDSVFKFLKYHMTTNPQQTIFIKNDFKKYKGINAYRVKDENKFKELITEHIKNDDYFLFGCDSCSVIESYYYDLKSQFDKPNIISLDSNKDFCTLSKSSKFKLYTSNIKFNIKNASVEFDKKFNFYSPSIETAIDVTLETPQDVFIYIKGNTIDASSSWQQTTRTRNIKNVYYFCDCDDRFALYDSLDEVDKVYETCLKENQNLNACSKVIDIDDEVKIIKNTFYDLFIYNEYVKDLYRTSRLQHYEEILKANEFNLQLYNEDDSNLIDTLEKNEMENKRTTINEALFNKFIDDIDFTKQEYADINEILSFLNLPINKTLLLEYKDIILDQYKLNEHLNIIKFFKDNDYIERKIHDIESKSLSVKCFTSQYHKIKALRQLEQLNKVSFINLNFNDIDLNQQFKCNNWEYVKKLFRTEKKQPATLEDFKPLYIQFIKNITISSMIESKQERVKSNKIRIYKINQDLINYHMKLNHYSNCECRYFNPSYSQFLNINAEDPFNDV